MGAAIPIQLPQIHPDLFQRPSGGEEGLAPLIQALEFYKTSKLKEQEQGIEQQKANSTGAVQKAQTDTLVQGLKDKTDAETHWQDYIDHAPASLQPILRGIDALRGLPAELQQVAGPMVAKVIGQQTGMPQPPDYKALTLGNQLFRSGLDFGTAMHVAGVNLRDEADKNPTDPSATPVPKRYLTMKYSPPGQANADLSRELRAQGVIINATRQGMATLSRDIKVKQQQIADDAWKSANPGKMPPIGLPITFQANDPAQLKAFHDWMNQSGNYRRLQTMQADHDNAVDRAKGIGMAHATDPATATADVLQQTVNLMAPLGGTPAVHPDSTGH